MLNPAATKLADKQPDLIGDSDTPTKTEAVQDETPTEQAREVAPKTQAIKQQPSQMPAVKDIPSIETQAPTVIERRVAENKVQSNPPQSTEAIDSKPTQKRHPNAVANPPVQASKPAIEQSINSGSTNIIDQVSLETKRLINAIKSDMKAGKNEHPVWMSARGLVISRAEFESHGMPHIKVLDEMISNNWIVRDAETKKHIHRTEKDGVKISAYLVNHAIAIALGFEDNNA